MTAFDDYLQAFTEPIRTVAQRARALVLDVMPGIREEFDAGHQNLRFSFTGEYRDIVVYIAAFKQHVNLGFWKGTELPDPDGLLSGTGKNLRHVKLTGLDDLNSAALRALLEAARDHAPRA